MLRLLFSVGFMGALASGLGNPAVADDLVAQDQTPSGRFLTATEVKPILAATTANWIAVREYDGNDWVYVTHLWAWRCGLLQIELGINGATPEVWPMPDCREETAQPTAILDSDGVPARTYAKGSVQSMTITLTYDDLSTQTESFTRAKTLIP